MKKPPKNETLEQAAIRDANERHARRLAEIKAMSARLRLADPYVAILKAKGVHVYIGEIRCGRGKPLQLLTGFFNNQQVQLAIDTLTANGFKELSNLRDEHTTFTTLVLGKGHLQLTFDLYPPTSTASKVAQA